MEQHPIPRQITTFEFKLIGFMTLTQFIYLIVFFPLAYLVFKLFPIPLINILLAAMVAFIGIALSFLPVNGRPLDVWVRNLYRRLMSPTQYIYHKENPPIRFLTNLFFDTNPHLAEAHIATQQVLSTYLSQDPHKVGGYTPVENLMDKEKQGIAKLLATPLDVIQEQIASWQGTASSMPSDAMNKAPQAEDTSYKTQETNEPDDRDLHEEMRLQKQKETEFLKAAAEEEKKVKAPVTAKKAFFSGVVKNSKDIPLPGILIYVKDDSGTPLRLLKSNPYGVFATYNSLPANSYTFELKDPKGIFNFDTMKVAVAEQNNEPLEFFSKELL